jgi:ATP-dependent RNA helicase RhlE
LHEADSEELSVTFESLDFHPSLRCGIEDRGYSKTTPVQGAVISLVRRGQDLVASAETGTGKTAAFLLPIVDRFLRHPADGVIRALVLAPTRELAVQIDDDLQGFSYHAGLSSIAVYGGVGMEAQERALRAGVSIVVATPGRLMDHMRSGIVDFSRLEVLVLDEADRMMDMGFWPDVRRIVSALPVERQTLLFSATMPREVMDLANEVVRDPILVQVGRRDAPAQTITHAVEAVAADRKPEWLASFLRTSSGPVLVFVRTRRGADRLVTRLVRMGVRVAALHSDRTQSERMAAVEGFRGGRYRALVATDLAARGLDVHGITHVINYEVPASREDYVHRAGRTGRAELSGTALTLVAPEERRAFAALEQAVGVRLQ